MGQDQLIYAWVSREVNERFNAALEANEVDAKSLIYSWMTDYIGKYEEYLAVNKLHENNPAAKKLYEEDLAAKKLHAEADKMGK